MTCALTSAAGGGGAAGREKGRIPHRLYPPSDAPSSNALEGLEDGSVSCKGLGLDGASVFTHAEPLAGPLNAGT